MTYEAGTYVKGDVERVAKNAKQAVALAFEGFKLKQEGEKAAAQSPAPAAQPAGDEAVRDVPSDRPVPTPPKQKD